MLANTGNIQISTAEETDPFLGLYPINIPFFQPSIPHWQLFRNGQRPAKAPVHGSPPPAAGGVPAPEPSQRGRVQRGERGDRGRRVQERGEEEPNIQGTRLANAEEGSKEEKGSNLGEHSIKFEMYLQEWMKVILSWNLNDHLWIPI